MGSGLERGSSASCGSVWGPKGAGEVLHSHAAQNDDWLEFLVSREFRP